MTTYYAAQLGISLSVVDCKASYLDSLKNSRVEDDEVAAKASLPADSNTSAAVGDGCVVTFPVPSSSVACEEDGVAVLGSTSRVVEDSVWGAVKRGPVEDSGACVKNGYEIIRSSVEEKASILYASDCMVSDVFDLSSSLPITGAMNSSTEGQLGMDGHSLKQRFNAKATLTLT